MSLSISGYSHMAHSFEVDHRWLKPGLYVADKYVRPGSDSVENTTLDLRFVRPRDPLESNAIMSSKAVHTIEHLGTTYLYNHSIYKDFVIYFGPMGCKTGFNLILAGDWDVGFNSVAHHLVMDMCEYIVNFDGNVPGATRIQCGNCLEHSLNAAKYHAAIYLRALKHNPCFVYPFVE